MQVITLPLALIVPGTNYSRDRDLDTSALVASIRDHGLIHPLVVSESEPHILISGFQRYAALVVLAGEDEAWSAVSVSLFPGTALDAALLNLEENSHRREVTIYDLGKAWAKIGEEFDLNAEELAARVNMSRTHVSNCLALVRKLCDEVKIELDAGLPVPAAKLILWKSLKPELQIRELEAWKTSKSGPQRIRPSRKTGETMLERARQCERRSDPTIKATAAYILGTSPDRP